MGAEKACIQNFYVETSCGNDSFKIKRDFFNGIEVDAPG
jgi:hypothetical protein